MEDEFRVNRLTGLDLHLSLNWGQALEEHSVYDPMLLYGFFAQNLFSLSFLGAQRAPCWMLSGKASLTLSL